MLLMKWVSHHRLLWERARESGGSVSMNVGCYGLFARRLAPADCRKNDLFTLNTNPDQFSVERLFSLDYVRSTFSPGWLRACVSSF
jgi:hypothetical protein